MGGCCGNNGSSNSPGSGSCNGGSQDPCGFPDTLGNGGDCPPPDVDDETGINNTMSPTLEGCPTITFPSCQADQQMADHFAGELSQMGSPHEIRYYWVDRSKQVDPLYDEPDPLYGNEPEEIPVDQVDSDGGWTFDGPYVMKGRLEFQETEPGGVTPDVQDEGLILTAEARLILSKAWLLRAGMISSDFDVLQRLPKEGDVVWVRYCPNPRNPYDYVEAWFDVKNADRGSALWNDGTWAEMWLDLGARSDFEPSRRVTKSA